MSLQIHHVQQSAGRPYTSLHGDTCDDIYQQRPPVMIQKVDVIYVYLTVVGLVKSHWRHG